MEIQGHIETVRAVAGREWGKEYPGQAEAQKAMASNPELITASAALEVVRRLNQVIKALADDKNSDPSPGGRNRSAPPDYAKAFPGIKPGTLLFSSDMDSGVSISMVISVHEGDLICVVDTEGDWSKPDKNGQMYVHWATGGYYLTVAEALRAMALDDLEYHDPRAEWCKACLKALDDGSDLDDFAQGFPDDDEESENEEDTDES